MKPDDVARMMDLLIHRGPDETGIQRTNGTVFGATRLAIRGIAGGRQPILDRETGVLVACNGEIDNAPELRRWLAARGRHVDETTDVAVIPALYLELGGEFVRRLAGAFAVAVWDPRGPRLLLARDRAGERPLFFQAGDGWVRFATEIAAMVGPDFADGDPPDPDPESLAAYLRFGFFAAPSSPFREVRKVGPAQIVTFRPEEISTRRYWRWKVGEVPKKAPSVDGFDTVFRKAVRRQSEADVPYGVFLSGGIDSSLVAAVARSLRPQRPLTAYTLRFGEPSYDEGDWAERVARILGCRSVAVWVRPEDLPAGIADLVRMVGEPLADPAWVPTALLARRAALDVKLALVGEGADEIFGGYPTYLGARAADWYGRWPRMARRAVRALVERWPASDNKVTLSFLLKRFVAAAGRDGIARHLEWVSNIPPDLLANLGIEPTAPESRQLSSEIAAPASLGNGDSASEPGGPSDGPRLLDLLQRNDLETSLAEGLLTKADRGSMTSAVELRAPFLDRAVLEWAAALPEEERVRGLTTKVFLKRYALRYLPAEIVHRRKRGLSVPLSRWLRGPLRDWARDRLGHPLLARAGIDPEAALELFAEHEARRADHARALWTIIVLDEWLRWQSENAFDAEPAEIPRPDERRLPA